MRLYASGLRDLDVVVHVNAAVAQVTVVGEIDLATAEQFYAALSRGQTLGARVVIADLRGVTFIDSSGLRGAAHRSRELRRSAARDPKRPCARLFELAGVSEELTAGAARG